MKKVLTLISMGVALSISAQVTNGGFENWSSQVLFENPADWGTGNGWDANGQVTTTKVTTAAPSGSYAVRLETMLNSGDTAFGFIMHGEFDEDPTGGVPWTTQIANIQGFARHNVMAGDTAILIFVAWDGGVVVGEDMITFTGAQSSWMPFTHPLNMGLITPDSVLVAAASSNAISQNGVAPGSWLELDAIRLTSPNEPNPDMLPNHDFENWVDVAAEDADDWSSYNPLVAGLGFTSVVKSTDSNSGSYSALVQTVGYENDTLVGILTNGTVGQQGPSGGVPYIAQPTMFSGAYKFLPSGQDTAHVAVLFYSNGSLVGVTGVEFAQATTSWTTFNEPVMVLSEPDTMAIIVYSGNNAGSMVYVDDLDLSGGDVGVEELGRTTLKIFPNPASDQVTIVSASDLGNAMYTLTDATGRVVDQRNLPINTQFPNTLDIGDLPSGSYVIEIAKGDDRFRERLIKQ